MNTTRTLTRVAVLATFGLALAACSSADPLTDPGATSSSRAAIVVGSQDYYSNEIVAEIYAQALEANGYTIDRQLRIGQREAYLPEIEAGTIDLFPEYTGPLLQFWEPTTTARLADDVYTALQGATPAGLHVLDQSAATDQDSYTVTREFAEKWSLTSIADLAKVTEPLVLGGNSEGENRPNGPAGMKAAYGLDVGFTPIEDGGGPLTVKALKDGTINLAIIYTADPSIQKSDLVTLEDTKGLFLASHVVPLASDAIDETATSVVNKVSAALTPDGLVTLNARSVDEQLPAATIAADWISKHDLG
ncbi:glycine/betaine ABC transporter (plasmid) [Cellulomonas sp. WB94]|uniref:ABC transporter substrate-binding protein n=1 Tax=Cellulomonas sp. WB94 TaxID=2173174 RepID=UPI000D5649BB|nr:ABC transporter substrate-binding protein [Cellulomonas sp. WB94]PVU84398.1 glycine/betaine ABC transporter [Cellulomonas sp. WB94]